MMWPALILTAYVLGSIPFGVIIARSQGVDIRAHGSGNVGATNVGRVLGRKFGITCFVLDMVKGALPVLIAGLATGMTTRHPSAVLASELWCWLAVAVAAVAGHMFSPFLRFNGGKGVATGFGSMLAMWPVLTIPAVFALVIWIVCVKLTGYVSLSSMTGSVSLPITTAMLAGALSLSDDETSIVQALFGALPAIIVTALIALLIVVQHRSNIGRLLRGEESNIKRRADA